MFMVRSTYGSDFQNAKISLINIINSLTNTISDDFASESYLRKALRSS